MFTSISRFRSGQWVCFSNFDTKRFQNAHKTKNGKVVGIFIPAARTSKLGIVVSATVNDGKDLSNSGVDLVHVVDEDGFNLIESKNGEVSDVKIPITNLLDLEPILSRDDVPQNRIKDNPNWTPTA